MTGRFDGQRRFASLRLYLDGVRVTTDKMEVSLVALQDSRFVVEECKRGGSRLNQGWSGGDEVRELVESWL